MKIIVVGGGVLGLMTARLLAKEHVQVVLVERQDLGQEASWAGGGIVSPLYPWRYSPPVTALANKAQAAYPQLVRELFDETGIDAELNVCGLLMVNTDDTRDALLWGQQEQKKLTLTSASGLKMLVSWLPDRFHEGIWMPDVGNIRNPRLLQALAQSLRSSANVAIKENDPVIKMRERAGRCCGVTLASGEELDADHVVVCSGAWSGELLAAEGVDVKIKPIQGQMLLYRLAPKTVPCMVMYQGRYLIPRKDGHVLCGSTLEDVGFNKQTSIEAKASLMQSAAEIYPVLAGLEPIAHWAGLRPGSPNGIPYIGELANKPGLWVNAGQYRNGLVLAPASAQLLVEQLLGKTPELDPKPYAVLF